MCIGLIGGLAEASDGVTNWKAVTPEHRKKIGPIVRHYMKDPHPFTACVRDNTKRFGEDRAKRICAVVKDMGMRTTKWRKGPVSEEELQAAIVASGVRVQMLEEAFGVDAPVEFALAERTTPVVSELAEMAFNDLALLFLAGDARGERMMVEAAKPGQHRHRDGKWANVLDRVRRSGDRSALQGADGGLRVNTEEPAAAAAEA
jgi:hypothetical protein